MKKEMPKGPRANKAPLRPAPRETSRESRGPETSHFLEDDTFSVKRDPKTRSGRDFDDDLIR